MKLNYSTEQIYIVPQTMTLPISFKKCHAVVASDEAIFNICYLEVLYSMAVVSSRRGNSYQILGPSFIPSLWVCTTGILSLILVHLLAHKAPLNSQSTLIRLLT